MIGFNLTFIFATYPTLEAMSREERISVNVLLPEYARERADLQELILTAAKHATYFTRYSLFVHCPEANLRNHPVVQREHQHIHYATNAVRVHFTGAMAENRYQKNLTVKFYAPEMFPFPNSKGRKYFHLTEGRNSAEQQEFIDHIRGFVEPILNLLNTPLDKWRFDYFEPRTWDKRQATRQNEQGKKLHKQSLVAERQQKQLEQKIATQAAKAQAGDATGPTTHGAGRIPGARPGIYKGVQMKSQLEIKFAAELDERGIRWVYEGETLGAAQYLMDFYLPDLGVWVEVKGNQIAKDRQVLPDVARMLKTERGQRLLMYTGSGEGFVINPSGYRGIDRKNFWSELSR